MIIWCSKIYIFLYNTNYIKPSKIEEKNKDKDKDYDSDYCDFIDNDDCDFIDNEINKEKIKNPISKIKKDLNKTIKYTDFEKKKYIFKSIKNTTKLNDDNCDFID